MQTVVINAALSTTRIVFGCTMTCGENGMCVQSAWLSGEKSIAVSLVISGLCQKPLGISCIAVSQKAGALQRRRKTHPQDHALEEVEAQLKQTVTQPKDKHQQNRTLERPTEISTWSWTILSSSWRAVIARA